MELQKDMNSENTEVNNQGSRDKLYFLGGLILLTVVLVASYSRCLYLIVCRWWFEPDYVYGFLVVPFAIFLLWVRREFAPGWTLRGNAWGLLLVAVGALTRFFSAYFNYVLLEPLSLVPCIAGLVLFVGGWKALRWAAPSILFLVFMVPLPGALAGRASLPLQRIGASSSAYVLQTLGIAAVVDGNKIKAPCADLDVAQACSGLKMMMLFFAICFGAAFVEKRSIVERALIIVLAAPIALVSNIIRITLTGLLQEITKDPKLAQTVFHDWVGFFMMPIAIGLLWLALLLWDKLLITPEVRPAAMGVPQAVRPSAGEGKASNS
jgi:exosortase